MNDQLLGRLVSVLERLESKFSPPAGDGLLSLVEAAERLQVSREKLRRMAAGGQIRAVRVGKLWRVPAAALSEL